MNDFATLYNRLARIINILVADLPDEAFDFTQPKRLSDTLTADNIGDRASGYINPHQFMKIHPSYWEGKGNQPSNEPTWAYWPDDNTPAVVRQTIAAASHLARAIGCTRIVNHPEQVAHLDNSDEYVAERRRRIAPATANAAALIDLIEPQLGLAEPATMTPDELPAAADLESLPPIARAIRASAARDAADEAVTTYADIYGAALADIQADFKRDNLTIRGWTKVAANALGIKPAAADEALRRYRRRLKIAEAT